MNKNEEKQNIKSNEKKQKKSFLSGLIQVEEKEDQEKSVEKPELQETPPNQQQQAASNQPPQREPVKEKGKKKQVESKEDTNGLTEEQKLLLNTGQGVNLIPKRSKAEITKEKKKFSFSVSSMVSLMVLIILSLTVVFFNIISKQQLNSAKAELQKRESEMQQYTDKIISNDEILERIDLYRYLQQGVFSPREILEYIMTIVDRSGNITIRTFRLEDNLSFEMNGSTTDLAVVAKLWYLLGINENIDTINLESVGKSELGANFTFAGELNRSYFVEK